MRIQRKADEDQSLVTNTLTTPLQPSNLDSNDLNNNILNRISISNADAKGNKRKMRFLNLSLSVSGGLGLNNSSSTNCPLSQVIQNNAKKCLSRQSKHNSTQVESTELCSRSNLQFSSNKDINNNIMTSAGDECINFNTTPRRPTGEKNSNSQYYCCCESTEADDCNHCQKLMQITNNARSRRRINIKDCEKNEDKQMEERQGEGRVKKLLLTLTANDAKWDSLMRWTVFALIFAAISPISMIKADDSRVGLASSNWERPGGMPKIAHLEVMCGSQHMEVHLAFDSPFQGLVTSKGMYGQQDCVYVPPRTGKNKFVFNIYYDKCGTKPDNHGKFYENTVVVQYDEELIEAWDEAKRLRCEWFNDYEKTATKTSPMVISDLEVVELNFHGDNVDCWMEIQEGKGPWAAPLNGIAPLGSTLTMVIAVKDPSGEFDMRVKDCEASDGQSGRNLQLSDPEGCIVRPKLIGKFSKVKMDDGRATVLTYAFISAFKFPDMLNVHLRCTVEICRNGCPDHCTSIHDGPKGNLLGQYSENEPVAAQSQNTVTKIKPNTIADSSESGSKNSLGPGSSEMISNQKPDIHNEALQNHNLGKPAQPQNTPEPQRYQPPPSPPPHKPLQQQRPIQHNSAEVFSQAPPQMRPPPPPSPFLQRPHPQRPPPHSRPPPPHHKQFPPGLMRQRPDILRFPPPPPGPLPSRFTGTVKHTIGVENGPPGPNFMEDQQRHHAQRIQNILLKPEPKNDSPEEISQRSGEPSKEQDSDAKGEPTKKVEKNADSSKEKVETEMLMEALPLKDQSGQSDEKNESKDSVEPTVFPKGPRNLRIRRSVTGSSDVVGVQGAFKVVSQADLNFVFEPNTTVSNPAEVLRGKMSHGDPIYGICLPRVGFGVVFFGLGLATLVAILIAAFLAYAHYTVQHYKGQQQVTSPGDGIQSLPSIPMPLPYQLFPMIILKKMW